MTSANLLWVGLTALSAAGLTAGLGSWRHRKRLLRLTDQFQVRVARDADKVAGLKSQVSALNEELKTQRGMVARLTMLTKSVQPPQTPAPASPASPASPMDEPFGAHRAARRENLGFEDTQILS